jgi:hypothetical protein
VCTVIRLVFFFLEPFFIFIPFSLLLLLLLLLVL